MSACLCACTHAARACPPMRARTSLLAMGQGGLGRPMSARLCACASVPPPSWSESSTSSVWSMSEAAPLQPSSHTCMHAAWPARPQRTCSHRHASAHTLAHVFTHVRMHTRSQRATRISTAVGLPPETCWAMMMSQGSARAGGQSDFCGKKGCAACDLPKNPACAAGSRCELGVCLISWRALWNRSTQP